jgi:hypothetical protein
MTDLAKHIEMALGRFERSSGLEREVEARSLARLVRDALEARATAPVEAPGRRELDTVLDHVAHANIGEVEEVLQGHRERAP